VNAEPPLDESGVPDDAGESRQRREDAEQASLGPERAAGPGDRSGHVDDEESRGDGLAADGDPEQGSPRDGPGEVEADGDPQPPGQRVTRPEGDADQGDPERGDGGGAGAERVDESERATGDRDADRDGRPGAAPRQPLRDVRQDDPRATSSS
jgi:hypothetical protein